MSEVTTTLWQGDDQPDEKMLRGLLEKESSHIELWSNASGDRYPVHSHDYHKVVYCVEGSIWFMITDERDREIELNPGDRIDIPAGIRHSAIAGLDGVTCLEAHK